MAAWNFFPQMVQQIQIPLLLRSSFTQWTTVIVAGGVYFGEYLAMKSARPFALKEVKYIVDDDDKEKKAIQFTFKGECEYSSNCARWSNKVYPGSLVLTIDYPQCCTSTSKHCLEA